ncbi:DMT family transporter [Peribacillus frigoritolerans]|uniref:DMT family transporter n=1 Tax=Peribacillus frigoritolerans TaxID=450367 RepID=UPI00227F054D|nr:EamA family transporter [Peribacillus frigoritolerans]MCY9002474.1 EamA family transporter [Peribacillus frigoritolerans]
MQRKDLLLGLLFTVLYASGAIVMKIGLQSAPPLTLATIRFLIAGALLILYLYVIKRGKYPLPNKREFIILFWLGLLNTTLFLGLGLIALQTVSSGIFNLFIPVNAFLYALLALVFIGQSITQKEWGGMIVSFIGLFVVTYPTLAESKSSIVGIILLICAVISMAVGSLIYKRVNLQLSTLVVNTWQVVFGGLILIIPALLLESGESITFDINFFGYLFWSVFVLSIFNINLWFYLLKKDAIKANNWLVLNPVAGFILAAPILGEPITMYTIVGTLVVLFGLYLSGNINIKSSESKNIKACSK